MPNYRMERERWLPGLENCLIVYTNAISMEHCELCLAWSSGKEQHDQLVMSALGIGKGGRVHICHILDISVKRTLPVILRILAEFQPSTEALFLARGKTSKDC